MSKQELHKDHSAFFSFFETKSNTTYQMDAIKQKNYPYAHQFKVLEFSEKNGVTSRTINIFDLDKNKRFKEFFDSISGEDSPYNIGTKKQTSYSLTINKINCFVRLFQDQDYPGRAVGDFQY